MENENTNNDFDARFQEFLKGAQAKVDEYIVRNGFSLKTVLGFTEGQKYIRVFKQEPNETGRSLYCFIDKSNGNILKGAGWKAPELRNPRSTIFEDDFGLHGVTEYGTVYLR